MGRDEMREVRMVWFNWFMYFKFKTEQMRNFKVFTLLVSFWGVFIF